MMSTRKRAVALDSSNSGQPMAKRVCHQWLPQSSPAPEIQTMVDSLDPSRSLTPLPLSTTTSSSPPASPVPQCSNKPELLLSASPSSSSDCLSQSLSPASLLSSLTPSSSSSPPTATTVSSPSIAQKTPSPDAVEGLPVFSPDDTSTEEARLAARYQDDFRRVWSSSVVMLQATVGVYELITRLGIWTGDSKDFGVLARAHPELAQVLYRTRETGDLREIFAHPAFHNSLNTVINSVIDCVSYIFTAIRGGALPSLSFLHHAGVESRNISYLHDLGDPSTSSSIKIADELMNTKRGYITATSTRKTSLLIQGLLQYWGLYFSFSEATSRDEAGIPSSSPDLAFALKTLARLRASSACGSTDFSRSLDRVFYALYLSRILVLHHFLDSLPPALSESQARKEWIYFQLAPPCTSSGVDIFTFVLEGVLGGDVDDLRRSAECKLTGLGWRNHKWFSRSLTASYEDEGAYLDCQEGKLPPLYLVIDEVETHASEKAKPRVARRAARRRAEVYSLFSISRPDSL